MPKDQVSAHFVPDAGVLICKGAAGLPDYGWAALNFSDAQIKYPVHVG